MTMAMGSFSERWQAALGGGSGLRIVHGTRSVPILHLTARGLSVDAARASGLPGLVHIYEGDTHLASGLICSDAVENGEHRFHFKRLTLRAERPPLDFAPGDEAFRAVPHSVDRLRRLM